MILCDLAASLNPGSHGRSGWACDGHTPIVRSCDGSTSYWGGVSCVGGYVTAIFIASAKLTGTLPPTLGSLRHLTSLDLHYNYISGTIPTTFGLLTQLASLRLDFNSISGIIPQSLCRISTLSLLSFGGNDLHCYYNCLSNVEILSPGLTEVCDTGSFV